MVTFNEVHEWMSQANLIILATILSVIIVASIVLQRRRKFVWHANTMLIVVIVAVLLTIVHMGPSFVRVFGETIAEFNAVALLGVVHGMIGLATISIGIWFLALWFLNESSGETRFCAPKKNLMRRILILWGIVLGLGIAYYPLHLLFT
jgi:hypothetical protein